MSMILHRSLIQLILNYVHPYFFRVQQHDSQWIRHKFIYTQRNPTKMNVKKRSEAQARTWVKSPQNGHNCLN